RFFEGDVKDTKLLKKLLKDCDYLIALAAKVGGVGYFHKSPYELFTQNELITISTLDAAIDAFLNYKLSKIVVLSSGMVFESTNKFPSNEISLSTIPPPKTTYGFQKLAAEYMVKGAWQQYKLPYTIIRPSNVVGIGDDIKSTVSHVIPDLVLKILKRQYPLRILGDGKQVRDYIHAKDLSQGIILSLFSKNAKNEDFNIGSGVKTSVLDLAKLIWKKHNLNKPFKFISDKPYALDLKKSIPDVSKSKKILGFKAKITLDKMLDEVVPWIKKYTNSKIA
ncbi:NAD-dependent epimerase, partial [Candidatus Roizmanbacteria bacterium RIFCSPHIGHO2_12_FULL_33_9]